MRLLPLIAALLITTAAAAAEPLPDAKQTPGGGAAKPEEKPEANRFVLLPEWLWLQALQTMNAQQALIEKLETENRNACGKRSI